MYPDEMRCDEMLADDSSGTDGDVEALDSSDYASDHAYETDCSLLDDVVTTCLKIDNAEEIEIAHSLFANPSLNQVYTESVPASPVVVKTEVVAPDPLLDLIRCAPSDPTYEFSPLPQSPYFAAPPLQPTVSTLFIGWNKGYVSPNASGLDHYTDDEAASDNELMMLKHFPLKPCEELASCAVLEVAGADMESLSPVDVEGMQLTPVHDHDLLDILI